MLGTKCLAEILSERFQLSMLSSFHSNIRLSNSIAANSFLNSNRMDVQNISLLPSDHFLVSFSGLRLKCFLREQIAHWMETTLDEATDPWGVKVERVEM